MLNHRECSRIHHDRRDRNPGVAWHVGLLDAHRFSLGWLIICAEPFLPGAKVVGLNALGSTFGGGACFGDGLLSAMDSVALPTIARALRGSDERYLVDLYWGHLDRLGLIVVAH